MHAAGAGVRRREIRPHRDVQLGRRPLLAHLIDVNGIALRLRMRIVPNRLHVHDMGEHQIGRPQLRHRHDDRSEPANLMFGRHTALFPRVRGAFAAVVDQRQTLAFRILESQRQPPVDLSNLGHLHGGFLQALLPILQCGRAGDAKAGAGDGVVAALFRQRRKIEKGDVAAGRRHPVGIKQVIGADIVLVHGLLDHAQAHELGVEFEVAGGVGRHGGEMVNSGKLHFVAP